MIKLPPELHIVKGTKGLNQGVTLPEKLKKRIPHASWMDSQVPFDKKKYIKETAEYLFQVYGIGSDNDQHLLTMLAEQIHTYCEAQMGLSTGVAMRYNNDKTVGSNYYLPIRDKAAKNAIAMMNELGLTPRGRLQGNALSPDNDVGDIFSAPPKMKK